MDINCAKNKSIFRAAARGLTFVKAVDVGHEK